MTNMPEYATFSQLGNLGRLGNQMFQIAMTIAYAIDTGKEFAFPKWEYSKYMQKELPGGFFINIDHRITAEFHYTPIPKMPGNVDLYNSFGQSAKYFAHQWNEIRPYLDLKPQYYAYIWKKYGHILAVKNCSIHVRRADYTILTNIEYHGLCPIEYYLKGVELIYEKHGNDVLFIICSDDIKWCKQNFTFPNQIFIEGELNVIDLFIMSLCKSHIITNSSFSLFPAIIHSIEIPDTTVIAPLKWFNNAPIITSDIYMPKWIKL